MYFQKIHISNCSGYTSKTKNLISNNMSSKIILNLRPQSRQVLTNTVLVYSQIIC